MTENEVTQIIKHLNRIEDKIDKDHFLLVGNGNERAVLPRLRSLEFFMKVLKWLSPILTALIIAALMYAVFGQP